MALTDNDDRSAARRILGLLVTVLVLTAGCTGLPDLTGDHPHGAEAPQDGVTRPPDTGIGTAPPRGTFATICKLTHVSQDDPIVFPRESDRAHAHTFAGSTDPDVDEWSTPESIVGHGTTCKRLEDESAYWTAALVQGGEAVAAYEVLVYYQTGGLRDPASIVPMPPGLKMIAGSSLATDPQDLEIVSWGCVGAPTRESGYSEIPTDCPGALRLKIRFPNCWNGNDLDSVNHQDHVAYAWLDDGSRRYCPGSHPVPIPELELAFHFILDSYDNLELSSGGIYSGHADFMNGWDEGEMARLTEVCLNVPRKCGFTAGGIGP